MPLISIIILNYNGKHHLQNCFDYVLNQSFTDFEIILVDNNSIDSSVPWIKENYPKIKVIAINSFIMKTAIGTNGIIAHNKIDITRLPESETAKRNNMK